MITEAILLLSSPRSPYPPSACNQPRIPPCSCRSAYIMINCALNSRQECVRHFRNSTIILHLRFRFRPASHASRQPDCPQQHQQPQWPIPSPCIYLVLGIQQLCIAPAAPNPRFLRGFIYQHSFYTSYFVFIFSLGIHFERALPWRNCFAPFHRVFCLHFFPIRFILRTLHSYSCSP